jgi:Tol biopolymer transport system component
MLKTDRDKYVTDWSRDGRMLTFFTTGDMNSKMDLWLLPLDGDRKPVPFLQTEFREGRGTFSPDGRWIAYQSDETSRWEIYVRAIDGSPGKWQVSIDGGVLPTWSSDGRRIFFLSTDRKYKAAAVRTAGGAIAVDSIRTMFDLDSRSVIGGIHDITRDGKNILAIVGSSRQTTPPITMVVNWDEELRKMSPQEVPDGR